jgi:uncharacterized protein YkwD
MRSRRHRLPLSAIAIVAALSVTAPAAHATNCAGADLLPTAATATTVKAATLCLLNNERGSQGVAPLGSDAVLEQAATAYSVTMIAQRFFAHVSPAGQRLEQRLAPYFSGAQTWDVGENLAYGETSMATPRAIVAAWMRSAGHRATILNARFTEIGIGIVSGSPEGTAPDRSATYTTHFGTRSGAGSTSASSSPRVSAATKRRITATCSRAARRTKASRSTRRARTARCVAKRLRAAAGARV